MKKFDYIQFCSCFILLFNAPFLGIGLYSFIKNNHVLSILIAFILSIIFIYLFLTIFNYQPKYNLKEKLYFLFNKKISLLLITIICICLLIIGIILSYDFNNFVISQFLSETPIYIIASIFALLYYYINKKGYDAIIRVSSILFFLNILIIIFQLICNIKGFNFNNLKPFNFSINFKSTIYLISIPFTLIIMLLQIPKNIIKIKDRHIYLSLIICFIYIIFNYTFTIGILGINLSKLYQYPFYIALKNISFINVFDRIENIIIIEWIFQIFITISFIINFISKMLKINHTFINVIIIFFTIFFFKNNTFFYNISLLIIPYIFFILIFILIIIFIQIKRKHKLSKLYNL